MNWKIFLTVHNAGSHMCQASPRQIYSLKVFGLIVMLAYATLQDQRGGAVEGEIKAGTLGQG
jgi:hypothetical protein